MAIAEQEVLAWDAAEDVARRATASRAAQREWAALGIDGRARILGRLQRAVVAEADALADVIVAETGKTREDAMNLDILYVTVALAFWRANAGKYLAEERVRSRSPFALGKKLVVRYEPLGLAGVIGPWNYPLANSFGDCIPALMAGNGVLLKPSEVTPRSAIAIAQMAERCGLPKGLLQVVVGAGETAGAVIDAVDTVMFTGSTATGRKVMERAAQTLTPVSLELGGKDPMVVLADADPERAASYAIQWGMCNAGQTCVAVERVYVNREIYDPFVRALKRRAEALRVGPPAALGTVDIGAMTTDAQAEIVERHVADAVAQGATVLTGGKRRDRFFEPTILIDVDHTMAVMREETFGPVLGVMAVASDEEALRLANDSPYGLSGSVFGERRHAERIARRIESGTVLVNDIVSHHGILELPEGGWKQSGIGARHGAEGIRKYCRRQALVVVERALIPNFSFFPNTAFAAKLGRAMSKAMFGRP